jgi:hypothetical protein
MIVNCSEERCESVAKKRSRTKAKKTCERREDGAFSLQAREFDTQSLEVDAGRFIIFRQLANKRRFHNRKSTEKMEWTLVKQDIAQLSGGELHFHADGSHVSCCSRLQ